MGEVRWGVHSCKDHPRQKSYSFMPAKISRRCSPDRLLSFGAPILGSTDAAHFLLLKNSLTLNLEAVYRPSRKHIRDTLEVKEEGLVRQVNYSRYKLWSFYSSVSQTEERAPLEGADRPNIPGEGLPFFIRDRKYKCNERERIFTRSNIGT
ncbi:hypothetical protein TNIN_339531 [Trichonephila inaurata madagascariensis]|uniref:Uncharacterized protein n=1 Tax=Trichonephila inaurata madagascariensis TaxID=2747483 RepID=A0A8X7BZT2_9ARAC|nr:hypothetical protein TNIN_339531 [Trichonephila inaurata madagascariensis]